MSRIPSVLGCCLLLFVIGSAAPSGDAQRGEQAATRPNAGLERMSRQTAPHAVTAAQLENVQARIATAQAILSQLQPSAKAAGAAAGWRQATLESLLLLSLPQLETIHGQAHDHHSLVRATAAVMEDPTLLGDPSADLVYTPITPCRYIDTRNAGGPITAAAPRGFDLALTGASYGGSAACSAQQNVVAAIAMNVTITEPVGAPGFLAVKPSLAAPVTSFMNWYDAGPHVQLANSGVVTVSQPGAPDEFVIQVSHTTHVIVDFFGVFQAPQRTRLLMSDAASPLTPLAPGAFGSLTSPDCPMGLNVTGGSCFTSPGVAAYLLTSRKNGNAWTCEYFNATGVTSQTLAMVHCAAIPGR